MRQNIPVSNVMTKSPVVVTPDTFIDQIHNLFERNSFHHLPVLSHGKVIGIISKNDYNKIRHMITYSWAGIPGIKEMYKHICAADIMSAPPLTIEPSDSIGLAADIFLANTIHALPVIDEGELVGIVTSHDLLSHAYQSVQP
jgi:acetoin utilization protein AcuB